jgi:hypothetical protein
MAGHCPESGKQMKKGSKKRGAIRAPENDNADPPDWTPLFRAFKDAFEWVLDVAKSLARDYPEEVATVERVRVFMRKRIAGMPAHVRVDDVLFTFGLIIGAIERDLGPVESLGPWFAPPLRLPSASEIWERMFPRHFGIKHRNAATRVAA